MMRLRASRRAQRWALGLVIGSLGAAAFAGWSAWQEVLGYPTTVAVRVPGPVVVEIPAGASFPRVIALLVDAGVLDEGSARWFRIFVLHRGAAGRITAGKHEFHPQMTAAELLDELVRPQPAREVQVTIPEGRHMLEVASILAAAGLADAAALEAAMRDRKLLDALGITGPTAEGYLFPDTYKFPLAATPREIVGRLVQRHRAVYGELRRRHRHAAETLARSPGFDDQAIVTLASIVEKETGARHERPIIAGVFLNRLRFSSFQPKKLETDPTIIYGCTVPTAKSAACRQFEGRIRRIHLQDAENPYNTYQHEGLPPGPISNPGRAALEAVFAPKESRFLFFVARNDGTHQFSKTRAEHEAAVELYMRRGAVGDGSAAGSVDPAP
jgi:UPF0755 protein